MSVANDQIFYPSLIVNLRLRFDESLQVDQAGSIPQPLPQSGIVDAITGSSLATIRPLVTQAGKSNLSFVMNRVPRTASVELPAYRTAGKFSLELDWRELPIDPRIVRSAGIEIYIGTVSPANFASGMTTFDQKTGIRKSILSTRGPDGAPRDDLMALAGFVDNWSVDHESEGSKVRIEGRDLRGIFLDSPINPLVLARINLRRDIINVVKDILASHPASQYLEILWNPNDWDKGRPPPVADVQGLTRVRLGASGTNPTGGTSSGEKTSYWDLITQYCQPRDSLVWREDLSWAPISTVKVGDRLMGFSKDEDLTKGRRFQKFEIATVEEVNTRRAPVVALHLESGRVVRCTSDHRWFTGRSEPEHAFAKPKVGRPLFRIVDSPSAPFDPDHDYTLGYARGIVDGDGCYIDKVYEYDGKRSRTKFALVAMNDRGALGRYERCCRDLGLVPHTGVRRDSRTGYEQPYVRVGTNAAIDMLVLSEEVETDSYCKGWLAGIFDAEGCTSNGLDIGQDREVNGDIYSRIVQRLARFGFQVREDDQRIQVLGGCREILRFFYLVQPAAIFKFQKYLLGMKMSGVEDRVARIEQCGEEEVVSLRTSTSTYFGQGYASHNCFLVGAIPFFRGRTLVIRPSKSIFDQSKPSGQSPAFGTSAFFDRAFNAIAQLQHPDTRVGQTWDPVFGGTGLRLDDDGHPFTVRKFIYGRNVDKLSFERKYTGVKVPVIKVVSYDTSSTNRGSAKLLTAIWPPDVQIKSSGPNVPASVAAAASTARSAASHVTSVYPSGEVAETDVRTISVPGVRDQSRLLEIAKSLYEEIGRGELGGSCATGFLSSFKGDNSDPDICRLRPGHAVEFAMDRRSLTSRAPASSTELALERAPFDEAVRIIKNQLNSTDENLARAIVASSRSSVIGLLQTFRTANVKFDWNQSSGLHTSFDFQNYFLPRHGVTEQTGANSGPPVRTVVSRSPRTAPKGSIDPPQPQITPRPFVVNPGIQIRPITPFGGIQGEE